MAKKLMPLKDEHHNRKACKLGTEFIRALNAYEEGVRLINEENKVSEGMFHFYDSLMCLSCAKKNVTQLEELLKKVVKTVTIKCAPNDEIRDQTLKDFEICDSEKKKE